MGEEEWYCRGRVVAVGSIYELVFSVALRNIIGIFHLVTREMDYSFPVGDDQVPDDPHDVRGASKAGEGGPWVMETFKKHPKDGAVVLGS